ncbi:hypothetical protein BDV06DRAFT_194978 [Aspergillus oleicola]
MIRTAKPKLSVSISAAQNTVARPSLSLKSPGPLAHSPRSPLPPSPAPSKRFSSLSVPQPPSYNYVNSCSSKSILKKQAGRTGPSKKIAFGAPTVHCITPIENTEEYYGNYTKLSKEERRWIVRE